MKFAVCSLLLRYWKCFLLVTGNILMLSKALSVRCKWAQPSLLFFSSLLLVEGVVRWIFVFGCFVCGLCVCSYTHVYVWSGVIVLTFVSLKLSVVLSNVYVLWKMCLNFIIINERIYYILTYSISSFLFVKKVLFFCLNVLFTVLNITIYEHIWI